ncbi:MAG: hypothetical protein HC844_18520 [Tabrizicola sp.]|nr:hypothetical protein [Tabrizicola sp.]
MRASVWVSLAIALAYGAALVLRTPLAFWLAIGYLGPALYRYVLTIPFAATPRDIGSTTGSLIGTAVQVLLMLAGIASLDPLSGFPLRLASHLSGAAP